LGKKKKKQKEKEKNKNMITKEQVLNNISSGWHSYIETVYNLLPELSFCSGVYMVERKNGMLRVIFSRTDLTTSEQEFILKSIDVEPIVQIAKEMFGPVGNLLEGKNVMKNILIGTNEFGKVWYGDIEGDSDYILGLCQVMSQRVGQKVTVVHESF